MQGKPMRPRQWIAANTIGLFIGACLSGVITGIGLTAAASIRNNHFEIISIALFGAIAGLSYTLIQGVRGLLLVQQSVSETTQMFGSAIVGLFGMGIAGTMVGGFQWWVAKPHAPIAWIFTSTAGWCVAGATTALMVGLNPAVEGFAVGAIGGSISGLGQSVLLQTNHRTKRWWAIASTLGWAIAGVVIASVSTVAGIVIGGVVAGAITALPLLGSNTK